ncbi:MAG TPA: DEAD/DEAH box helicase, partial [Burkholderiaceae bacterium]|nr:DEAD/DEAH box helicase [Burkholderiaceae bacterium]
MTDSLQDVQGAAAPASISNEFLTEVHTDSLVPAVAATPDVVAVEAPVQVDAQAFAELGLAPELVAAVRDLGYTEPTAVQHKAIPLAMGDANTAMVDLMVSSQTGSGKTAAFLLPVLHTLLAQQNAAHAQAEADFARQCAEAAERGEPAPKRPRRQNPTNPRQFKAATPGALVLCPTRELAQQVAHDAIGLVQHCRGLRIANVVGGMPY